MAAFYPVPPRHPLQISCIINGKPVSRPDGEATALLGDLTRVHTVIYTIVNHRSNETYLFMHCGHKYKGKQVEVILKDEHKVTKGAMHRIEPLASCLIKVKLKPRKVCGMYLNILLKFRAISSGKEFAINRKITYDCMDESYFKIFEVLKPQEEDESDEDEEQFADLLLVGFDHGGPSLLENTRELMEYDVPADVRRLVESNKKVEIRNKLNIQSLTYDSYQEYFRNLVYLEEIQLSKDIRHYTMKKGTLVQDRKPDRRGLPRFRLMIPGLAERKPSVLRGDKLHIIPLPPGIYKYEGVVDDTSKDTAFLVFSPRFLRQEDVGEHREFRVEFALDRLKHMLMQRAVDIVSDNTDYKEVLFPSATSPNPLARDPDTLDIECKEKRVHENAEQLTAVKHIVCGTSRPAPYLIYGPPGTGKTTTLVEAIKQVCEDDKNSKILVCAPQNYAADFIAELLLEHVDPQKLIRFNAITRSYYSLSEQILRISNYDESAEKVTHPKKAVIAQKQIVISTLITSGRLVSAELTNHFTHIFIDEAGFATEPETVIPLGLLSPKNGQLVLAGDPKQLGPIIRSSLAISSHFGRSLLERVMTSRAGLYSPDSDGSFNNNFVTKLKNNFRSHPEILKIPNELFYNSELRPCANKEEREELCSWEGLPKPSSNFPMIFHRVDGRGEQEACSPSWLNRLEVIKVKEYVEKLMFGTPRVMPEDIGIISPYNQQVKKIRQALGEASEEKMEAISAETIEIEVGSVEKFQGGEKKVIIISTLRGETDEMRRDQKFGLGFVKSPKRFNVAITRAKALLIIVGNPLVLCTDENWRRLIQYIVSKDGYIGDPVAEELLDEESANRLFGQVEQLEISSYQCDKAPRLNGKSDHLLYNDEEWERND